MKGFEIIESGTRTPATTNKDTPSKSDKAMDILSNNFENILNIAENIVEIEKMKIVSEACLKKMAEDRKRILDEAQAYAIRKRADTTSVIDRLNIIRSIMQDFYIHSQGNLYSDDFRRIIT